MVRSSRLLATKLNDLDLVLRERLSLNEKAQDDLEVTDREPLQSVEAHTR